MLNLYKKKGETPLERLNRLRLESPIYKNATLSYAGRLDPMAEGVLLVMEGDENKEREKYLNLDKTYETEILFGISTDTHDVLGIVENVNDKKVTKEIVEKEIKSRVGKFVQKYPNYSSKTVDGVPLFEYARKGEVVEKPEREVILFDANLLSSEKISREKLLERVLSDISLVKGDFRQEEIEKRWKCALEGDAPEDFFVIKLELQVSSGFYVRVFADTLGNTLGVGAIALSIKRTKAGDFKVENSDI